MNSLSLRVLVLPPVPQQSDGALSQEDVLTGHTVHSGGRRPHAMNMRVITFQRPQTHRLSYSQRPPQRPLSSQPSPTPATTPTGSIKFRRSCDVRINQHPATST